MPFRTLIRGHYVARKPTGALWHYAFAVALCIGISREAHAIDAVSFTANHVIVSGSDGGTREFRLDEFKGATGFSGLLPSPDKGYLGWQIEEAPIPNSSPVPLGVFIVGPTSKLEVGNGQMVVRWRFLQKRAIEVCTGPLHGPDAVSCKTYALPE